MYIITCSFNLFLFFFFFNDTATTEIYTAQYTLSLHDALPILILMPLAAAASEYPELVQRYLFSAVKPERDKFAALHAALFSGGSFLYVPDGVTVEQPL